MIAIFESAIFEALHGKEFETFRKVTAQRHGKRRHITRRADLATIRQRPDAFVKVVRVMPSWRALEVMIWANRVSVPASFSAITVAASFADLVIKAPITSRTVIVWSLFEAKLR